MQKARIELPPKLVPVLSKPLGYYRYRALYGGRGAGRSQGVATIALIWGFVEPLRILCTREFQASIAESFHAELRAAIQRYPWLENHYDVGRDYIRGANGTEFFFRGLRHNSQAVKSLANIDLTIIEEAETVPEHSWLDLEATVFRNPKSEIIAIWNPRDENSPVDKRFRQNPPDNAAVVKLDWRDNPFFPAGLDELRRNQITRLPPEIYEHVWEGAYLEISDAQVLKDKYRIATFEDPQDEWVAGPYYGADWGFSSDPTALVRFFVSDDYIWITHEAVSAGVEVVDTPDLFDRVPESRRFTIRADNARPEMISHMSNAGFRIQAAKKWPGSVEDGVSWIRGHREVIIHERCRHVITEARMWSYKTDKNTGDPLPDLVDAYNHTWDAIRYGAEPMIRKRKGTPRVRSL